MVCFGMWAEVHVNLCLRNPMTRVSPSLMFSRGFCSTSKADISASVFLDGTHLDLTKRTTAKTIDEVVQGDIAHKLYMEYAIAQAVTNTTKATVAKKP
jgi:hypothetical protein